MKQFYEILPQVYGKKGAVPVTLILPQSFFRVILFSFFSNFRKNNNSGSKTPFTGKVALLQNDSTVFIVFGTNCGGLNMCFARDAKLQGVSKPQERAMPSDDAIELNSENRKATKIIMT